MSKLNGNPDINCGYHLLFWLEQLGNSERKQKNHATTTWFNEVHYFLFVSPKR